MTSTENLIRVLLIEDDEEDYMLTRDYLKEADSERFSVAWAQSMKSGLEILTKQKFDAVLLDLSLPDAQRLDGFRELRRRFPRLPIIILTGLADEDTGTKAVHEGAQDYIIKRDLDGTLLHHALRYAIERKKTADQLHEYADQLRRHNNEITENLKLARKVQQRLLPQENPAFPRSSPPDQRTLYFSHIYHPSTIMSGDFFDILEISDTKAGAFICDVMGHGMRAGLVTAVVRGFVEKLREFADQPGRFLTEMNRSLISILQSPGELIFVSALYVVVDAETGDTRYTVAGHPPPLCGSADGTVDFLDHDEQKQGPVLGMFEEEEYLENEFQLSREDLLICFTDGIYEVLGKQGEEYGSTRVIASLHQHMDQPLDTVLQRLVTDVEDFAETGPEEGLSDDICLLGMKFCGQNPVRR